MPEHPFPRKQRPELEATRRVEGAIPYAELHAKTNFSFLSGASHPDELVSRAAELGYRAIAVTDEATLAGVVRAHTAAKTCGIKLLVGAELVLEDAGDSRLVLLALDRRGYGGLSKLLTLGRRRVERSREPASTCRLSFADVAAD